MNNFGRVFFASFKALCLFTLPYSSGLKALPNSEFNNLTIVVNAPFNTPSDAQIFLTGNFLNCNWRPNCLLLKAVGNGTHSTSIKLKSGSYQLKMTRGSWRTEASASNGAVLNNQILDVDGDTEQTVVFDVVNWADLGPLKQTGRIQEFTNFYSPELANERKLSVWLPPSYSHSSGEHFPVIYAHDGQNLFDPKKSSYGVDWSIDEIMTKLIANGEAPPAIVVGIHHLERGREFNDADQGLLYSKFLVETLKPFIDSNFATLADKDNTFLLGSSFGGVISATTLFRYPHIFSKAAALSIKTHGFDRMLFSFIEERVLPRNVSLYMDNGAWGIDKSYVKPNREFVEKLLGLDFPQSHLIHREFKWANHNETSWARRADIALKFLLNH